MKHFCTCLVLAVWAWISEAGQTYNNGQWTPSVYVAATTYSTSVMVITQAANVVVTMTSYVPCPVTSTTWVYQQCGQCPPVQTTIATQPVVGVGTTTETLYTTETPRESLQYQTVTSNGFVLVIANPTQVAQNGSGAKSSAPLLTYYTAAISFVLAWIA